MKNNIYFVATTAVLVFLLILLSDVFMLWMPGMMSMFVLLIVSVLLCVWVGFILREDATDEREVLHRMYAGRVAYLLGIGVLTLALLVQGLAHTIDPWIAIALLAMVSGKTVARLYLEHSQ